MSESTRVEAGPRWERVGVAPVDTIAINACIEYRISVEHLQACTLRPNQRTPRKKTRIAVQLWRRERVDDDCWSLRTWLNVPLHEVGAVADALRLAVEQANANGWR